MNEEGTITVASDFSVRETVDRLASIVGSNGFTVFAQIDHTANATKIGMKLRPTELLIFGNPKIGTLLMQDKQVAGLDLPVKVLVWEDADARVWLSYETAAWIAQRHGLSSQSDASIETIDDILAAASKAATAP